MACELDRYVPTKAFELAQSMVDEYGPDAFAIARQRLKMRIRDELPSMINLYAGVCTLLAEQHKTGRNWIAFLRRAASGGTGGGAAWRTDVAMRHELVPVRISVLRPSRHH